MKLIFNMRIPGRIAALFSLLLIGILAGLAQQNVPVGKARPGGRGEARMPSLAFRTEVPAQPYDLILGRPTKDAVTVSVLAYAGAAGTVAYGPQPGQYTTETPLTEFPAGLPVELRLGGLQPATRYYYQLRLRPAGRSDSIVSPEYSFTTARPPGATFTFTLQADSHLDAGTEPEIYLKSLGNALAARPDFHVDLGDTFMNDKRTDYRDALPQYLAQRYYFGQLAHTAPLFLVLGNHDGEKRGKDGDDMAVWSNSQRKKYFPNPEPDAFYSGNGSPYPRAGLLQDYYAFAWGDALFVMLDPYWFGQDRGRDGDNWGRSLGREQYEWLRRTLATSQAKFTFVFIHHLVGGETREGRGGAEAAAFFEWGGANADGSAGFAQHRPGWAAPIHDLLAAHGGVIVFHGHDHLYARQERDGVIYQLVPQPGHGRFDNIRSAAEYGYHSGVIQGASGILRVTVAPTGATVEYVRAYPASAENTGRRTGDVTDQYRLILPAPRPKS